MAIQNAHVLCFLEFNRGHADIHLNGCDAGVSCVLLCLRIVIEDFGRRCVLRPLAHCSNGLATRSEVCAAAATTCSDCQMLFANGSAGGLQPLLNCVTRCAAQLNVWTQRKRLALSM